MMRVRMQPRASCFVNNLYARRPSYFTGCLLRRGSSQAASQQNNIPPLIQNKIGANLHMKKNHPLFLIKSLIHSYFSRISSSGSTPNLVSPLPQFSICDDLSPKVSVKQNFDDLLIPQSHESRLSQHSYFFDQDSLLRTHTSAHQSDLLRRGEKAFLVTGDVYRRDTVDATHYPIFHQMEGVRTLALPLVDEKHKDAQEVERQLTVALEKELKSVLEGLMEEMFGKTQVRWVDAYFPFTLPSWEMEIFFQGSWLEVLGCGLVQVPIMSASGRGSERGWAFGLGLERLAMIKFDIPDIRLFWSEDPRFLTQFTLPPSSSPFPSPQDIAKLGKFKAYSKFPVCKKDLSFWVSSSSAFHENDFFELVREEGGDLVENVELIDTFSQPSKSRKSFCYRIHYRSMDRNLTNDEINQIQSNVRDKVASKLNLELR